jgi:WD40 repeat protein
LNREEFKSLHKQKEYALQPVKCPQYFFTLQTLIVRSGIEGLNLEGKHYKTFNKLSDKIEDDQIECTYLTPNNTFMAVITSGYYAYCYKMPNYETKWTIDIKLSNDQIARIMKAFRTRGMNFDMESSCNTFERNWVSACAVTNQADILAVAYVDGYINLTDTASRDLLHIIHAHVDLVSCMQITKNDILLSGGIDSNVKVWTNLRQHSLTADYVFLKHTDKITFIRSFTVGDNEYILSADDEGMIYYWQVGSYRAEKFVTVDEGSFIDGNDQIVFALCIEDSTVMLKKYSFAKRVPLSKVIIRYYEDTDEIGIRSLLGFNDSEQFCPKSNLSLNSEMLFPSSQKHHNNLAA